MHARFDPAHRAQPSTFCNVHECRDRSDGERPAETRAWQRTCGAWAHGVWASGRGCARLRLIARASTSWSSAGSVNAEPSIGKCVSHTCEVTSVKVGPFWKAFIEHFNNCMRSLRSCGMIPRITTISLIRPQDTSQPCLDPGSLGPPHSASATQWCGAKAQGCRLNGFA